MRLTGHQIMMAVCHHMKIHPAELQGKSRDPKMVRARRIIAQRMKAQDYKISIIAKRLNRDHTTIYSYLFPNFRADKQRRYLEKKREKLEARALQEQQHSAHPG